MFDKRLIEFVPEAKKHIAKNVFLQWLSLILNVILMGAFALFLKKVTLGQITSSELLVILGVVILTILGRHFLTRLAIKESYFAAKDVKIKIREAIYQKLLKLGSSYLENDSTSEVVQASVEGVEQLEIYFSAYLPQFFYAMLAPVTLFIILSTISFKAALILLISTPLIPLSIVAVQKIAKRLLSTYWGQYVQMGDSFLENLQGLTTLKIYSADAERHEKMNVEAEKFRRITMRVLTMQLNSISVMDLIAYGGSAIGIILAIMEYRAGAIGFVGAFLIIMLSAEFFLPMRALGSYFHVAMNGMAANKTIFGLLNTDEPQWGTTDVSKDAPFNLEIVDVGFAYKENQTILSNITLTLKDKDMVAVVGESGSGKSTLAGILAAINTGYTGSIKLSGVELNTLSRNALLNKISYIGSNSYLFKGTVLDQLKMGNPNATESEMWDVLEQVQLKDFIASQGGLSFELTERASNLSGGQRQRLALARALLKDSSLYIFDEATSNIDVESENAIIAVLHQLKQKKSILLITHRLANSVEADCLYVLKNSKIIEQGNHEMLLEQKGHYYNLWQTQYNLEHFTEEREIDNYYIETKANNNTQQQAKEHTIKKRSSFAVMMRLITLVKPLVPFMLLSILMGVLGFLAAIFIPVIGGYGILKVRSLGPQAMFSALTTWLIICAVSRGILRYIEQMGNHYIAFKLLAKIRDEVFASLRKLAPAKLEVKDRGNLISLITSDIELLEVFYAHTISPIGIAFITSLIMTFYIGSFHPLLGLIALIAFAVVGILLPITASKNTKVLGQSYRHDVGALNSFFLESLRGINRLFNLTRQKKDWLA